jgi:hypothetical protein
MLASQLLNHQCPKEAFPPTFKKQTCDFSNFTYYPEDASVWYVSEDSNSVLHDEGNGDIEAGAPCHIPISHGYIGTFSNDKFFHSFGIQIPH